MTNWTDLKLGQAVTVKQGKDQPAWTSDWTDQYVIVGMEINYRGDGQVNFSLMTQSEIDSCLGSTDGFRENQLTPV